MNANIFNMSATNLGGWLDPALCERLCLTLLHSLWQVAILAAAAWAFERVSRKRGAARLVERSYVAHVAALVLAMLALPITFAAVGGSEVAPRPVVAVELNAAPPFSLDSAEAAPAVEEAVIEAPFAITDDMTALNAGVEIPKAQAGDFASRAAPWLAAMYLLGVLVMLARLAAGMWHAQRLVAKAEILREGPLVDSLRALAKGWNMRVMPALARAERIVTPKVVGLARPMILLPASAITGLSCDELTLILAHELAHVRRHDMWVNLVQRLAEAVLFFNPALWLLSRRVSALREYCCDELVCREIAESEAAARVRYAQTLVRVVEVSGAELRGKSNGKRDARSELATLAASGRSPSELRRRVAHLFGEPCREPMRLSRSGLLALALLIAALLVGPTVWNAKAQSEDKKETAKAEAAATTTDDKPAAASDTEPRLANLMSDEEATALARRVHADMSAIDKLPSFYVRTKTTGGYLGSMTAVKEWSEQNMVKALDEPPTNDPKQVRTAVFAWDEERFLDSSLYPNFQNSKDKIGENQTDWWGSETEGWYRKRRGDGPRSHVLRSNGAKLWEDMMIMDPQNLRITPHKFWWGDTSSGNPNQTFSSYPPRLVEWAYQKTVTFGGESCDVLSSKSRDEKLWVGQESGRLRGYLKFIRQGKRPNWRQIPIVTEFAKKTFDSDTEFYKWLDGNENSLDADTRMRLRVAVWESQHGDWTVRPFMAFRLSDYREIAPSVWWPFKVEHTSQITTRFRRDSIPGPYLPSDTFDYHQSVCEVEEVSIDKDLSALVDTMRPEEGDQVLDQRFGTPVEYKYRKDMPEAEILALVNEKAAELAKNQEQLKRLTEPFDKMVGQAAPVLPAEGWIGEAPKLAGKPYLIHFWATWCGPCKNDMPLLKSLAANKQIVGVHPSGTPAEEIQKVIYEHKLPYPTIAAPASADKTLFGYANAVYPWCVLVGADGSVIAHDSLTSGILDKWPVEEKEEDLARAGEEKKRQLEIEAAKKAFDKLVEETNRKAQQTLREADRKMEEIKKASEEKMRRMLDDAKKDAEAETQKARAAVNQQASQKLVEFARGVRQLANGLAGVPSGRATLPNAVDALEGELIDASGRAIANATVSATYQPLVTPAFMTTEKVKSNQNGKFKVTPTHEAFHFKLGGVATINVTTETGQSYETNVEVARSPVTAHVPTLVETKAE